MGALEAIKRILSIAVFICLPIVGRPADHVVRLPEADPNQTRTIALLEPIQRIDVIAKQWKPISVTDHAIGAIWETATDSSGKIFLITADKLKGRDILSSVFEEHFLVEWDSNKPENIANKWPLTERYADMRRPLMLDGKLLFLKYDWERLDTSPVRSVAVSALVLEANVNALLDQADAIPLADTTTGTVHVESARSIPEMSAFIVAGEHFDARREYDGGWFSIIEPGKGIIADFRIPDATVQSVAFDPVSKAVYLGGGNGRGTIYGDDGVVERRGMDGALSWRAVLKDAYKDSLEVAALSDGVIVAFHMRECPPIENCFGVVRFDQHGNTVWQRRFGIGNNSAYPQRLIETQDYFILTGTHDAQSMSNVGFVLALTKEGDAAALYVPDLENSEIPFASTLSNGNLLAIANLGRPPSRGQFTILPRLQ